VISDDRKDIVCVLKKRAGVIYSVLDCQTAFVK
jgi:hypothetical protein